MIKDIKELAHFIPDTSTMGLGTFKSADMNMFGADKYIYAVCVDKNLTISSFRAEITIYNMRNKALLIIGSKTRTINSATDYISVEKDASGKIDPKLIPFHTDNNGIYLKSESVGNVSIYFTANLADIPILKRNLMEARKEKVIVAEEIIV